MRIAKNRVRSVTEIKEIRYGRAGDPKAHLIEYYSAEFISGFEFLGHFCF